MSCAELSNPDPPDNFETEELNHLVEPKYEGTWENIYIFNNNDFFPFIPPRKETSQTERMCLLDKYFDIYPDKDINSIDRDRENCLYQDELTNRNYQTILTAYSLEIQPC
jgi:hypothetical protein